MWVLCVQIKWFLLFLYSCPSNRSKRTFFSSFKWKLKSNVQCTYTTGTHRTKTLFEESKIIFFSCSIRGKLHCFCIVFLCAYGLIRFGLLLFACFLHCQENRETNRKMPFALDCYALKWDWMKCVCVCDFSYFGLLLCRFVSILLPF